MTDYFVKTGGNDSAAGTSDASAWATIDKLNAASLSSGDNIFLNRTDTWREQVVVTDSGVDGNPITFGAYGTGVKPKLLGSNDMSDSGDWIDEGSNIWRSKALTDASATGSELLTNQNFVANIVDGWTTIKQNGANGAEVWTSAAGEYSPDAGGYKFTFGSNNGPASTDIQFFTDTGISITKGEWYRFTFKMKASSAIAALPDISFFKDASPFTPYFSERLYEDPAITKEWSAYEVYMKAGVTANDMRVRFALGDIDGMSANEVIYIDTTSFKSMEDVTPFPDDVANIVFDDEASVGVKAHTTVGTDTTWEESDLTTQDDFWHDSANFLVKMYSSGNPATVHSTNIEVVNNIKTLEFDNQSWLVFENLDCRYSNFVFSSEGTTGIIAQHLDCSYIGGAIQPNGIVRAGNALEFWESNTDGTIRYCTIDNIYEGGISFQGIANTSVIDGMDFSYNKITNCEYSFSLWLDNQFTPPDDAEIHNVGVYNNTCLNAGSGWSHYQREVFPRGVHLNMSGTLASAVGNANFIKNNIFYRGTEGLVRWDQSAQAHDFALDNNCYFQPNSTDPLVLVANGATDATSAYTFAEFADYQTNLAPHDANSIAADPLFVNVTSAADLSLTAASPCINAGADVGLTIDFAGNPILGIPDMGAYEFQADPIFTTDTLQLSPGGWAINTHTDDGSIPIEIQAAPGAGMNIKLREINISTDDADVVFLSTRESATATASRILGPLHISADRMKYKDQFIRQIVMPANQNLMVNTSAATAINIYASGDVS